MSDEIHRKLAAIVSADVVGYSRLMGADDAGTLAALRQWRAEVFEPAISSNRGNVVKNMGDGWLVEFDSAGDAVTCAIQVQEKLSSHEILKLRIGLHIGDIAHADGDIYGDGVNIAARLQEIAEPGAIVISDVTRRSIDGKLAAAFSDLGPQELKNIAEPIAAFGWGMIATRAASAPLRLPDKPSIAVLAFNNMTGDPSQEYFADGFTEDLIASIAQSKDLFVIARNSSFTYKARAVTIPQIAEELGVRYVVEGSIRRIGENMRITAQLIDAANGAHVWAKRFDEPMSKLFDLQDEISQEIAGALLASVGKSDLAKASQKRPKDHSAYDYVLRARAQLALANQETTLQARRFAEQAIVLDPDYAPAYAILGETFSVDYIRQWDGPDALERAYDAAQKAVGLDPLSSDTHALLGRIFLRRRQYDDAVATHKKSIALNPNRADSYAFLADTLTFMDRADEAIDTILTAMRLDPYYPVLFDMYLGRAYYFSKQYDKAIAQLRTCALRAPDFRPCYMFLAPAYAELGNQGEAQRSVETLLKIAPDFAISTTVQKHLPFVPSAMQFYIHGLRKAGVPE
jgi:TolB-like protein